MSKTAWMEECPKCGHRARCTLETDGRGALVETPINPCEHQRKRLGICQLCDQTVASTVGRALYCATHRLEQQNEKRRLGQARARAKDREKDRAKARDYYWRNREKVLTKKRTPEEAVKRRAWRRKRERYGTEAHAKRLAANRRYYEQNRERRRAQRKEAYQRNREAELEYARERREMERRIRAMKRKARQ